MLLAKAFIRSMQERPNTEISKMILNSVKSHKYKFQKPLKKAISVVLPAPKVMGFREYLGMACRDEQAFEEIVKRESKSISLPVRMFLQDKIRNAVNGLDENKSRQIMSALRTVGL